MSFKQIMPAVDWYWHHEDRYDPVVAFALNGIGDMVALVYKKGQGNAYYQPADGELIHGPDMRLQLRQHP